jgi:L-lactate dehydrogenase complex protein LldE
MPKQVALFITCLTDQFYPHVGIAVTRILEHYGCTVYFPRQQTCCGQQFNNNGYPDEARELAKRMIQIFEPYEYVVTPSGSCCAGWRHARMSSSSSSRASSKWTSRR